MKSYVFYFDDNYNFVCTKITANKTIHYYNDDALALLKEVDNNKFNTLNIKNKKIVLDGKDIRVLIDDVDLFFSNNYQRFFVKNIKKICKGLEKYQKHYVKGSFVKKGKYVGTAVTGLLAACALSVTAGNLKEVNVQNDIAFEIEDDIEKFDIAEPLKIDAQVYQQNHDPKLTSALYQHDGASDELTGDIINDELQVQNNDSLTMLEESNSEQMVNISYDSSYDEVKYNNVVDNYLPMIEERATRWGVSVNLVLSMIAQESGGYVDNLMQIQFNSWKDMPITLYNFEKQYEETIILTDHPNDFAGRPNTQLITPEDLLNPKTNISVGCIILRYSFEKMHYNIPAAIQCYNFGVGNMLTVLEETANEQGCSVEDLLEDQDNVSFLDYRDIISVGDPLYLEHVLRFLEDPENGVSIKYTDSAGNEQERIVRFSNENTITL